jgi:exopolysaccharide biosynthesis polyprenyl glycosylphosphotransferase
LRNHRIDRIFDRPCEGAVFPKNEHHTMIRERHRGATAIHAIFQAAALAAGFYVWYLFVEVVIGLKLVGGFSGYSIYALVAVLALWVRAAQKSVEDAVRLSGVFWARMNLAGRQTLFVGTVIVFFLVATKDKEISRVFLFSWVPILYATLALTNLAMPHLVLPIVFPKSNRQRFLLATRQEDFRKIGPLREWLQRQQRMGITVCGVLSPGEFASDRLGVPRLGGTDGLEEVFRREKPDVLMCLEPPGNRGELARMLDLAEGRGARLIFWDDLEQRFGARAWSAEVDGLNFVHFRREPLESPFNQAIKRLFDLWVASVAVVFVMPWLCVLVWCLHRLQSPGPLFFRQQRAGLGGGEFRIFKFRTMHTAWESNTSQAREGDPRIFPAGRWLRKTSLDEIPQFLNVLRGEMSVVGPRPHLPEHNSQWERLLASYNVRTVVRPGVTGLAQVRGMRGEAKTDEDVLRRIEADLEYIENYSPLVDVAITVQTAWQVFFPKQSAY